MQLCLNMIVRDEAEVIVDTLDHIIAHFPIASWVIHDTGSNDDTPNLIRKYFENLKLPGKLIQCEWKSFGENRQWALETARGHGNYVLFFDADNRIEGDVPKITPTAHSFTLNMRRSGVVYPVKAVVRNDGSYVWRGVIHEALYYRGKEPEVTRHLDGDYVIVSQSIGARSKDAGTYYRDATILSRAIETISDEDRDLLPRYTFYCANSWRDAQCPREAAHWYRRRIALAGWVDEVYCSWLGLGIELEKSGEDPAALDAYMSGHNVSPDRAECLYHAARLLRRRGNHCMALIFAAAGRTIKVPSTERLFVWRDIYQYWMDFEYLMCLVHLGRLKEGNEAIERMRLNNAPSHLFDMIDNATQKFHRGGT